MTTINDYLLERQIEARSRRRSTLHCLAWLVGLVCFCVLCIADKGYGGLPTSGVVTLQADQVVYVDQIVAVNGTLTIRGPAGVAPEHLPHIINRNRTEFAPAIAVGDGDTLTIENVVGAQTEWRKLSGETTCNKFVHVDGASAEIIRRNVYVRRGYGFEISRCARSEWIGGGTFPGRESTFKYAEYSGNVDADMYKRTDPPASPKYIARNELLKDLWINIGRKEAGYRGMGTQARMVNCRFVVDADAARAPKDRSGKESAVFRHGDYELVSCYLENAECGSLAPAWAPSHVRYAAKFPTRVSLKDTDVRGYVCAAGNTKLDIVGGRWRGRDPRNIGPADAVWGKTYKLGGSAWIPTINVNGFQKR